jgi:8-oxo-dGTP pyrophosphatase MutT (NUDIX family)
VTANPLCATVSLKAVLFGPRGRVLLVHDGADGVWELPGGRLDAGERPHAGLRREVREETGIESVEVVCPVHTDAWENSAGEGRFAVAFRCDAAETGVALSDEHDDFRWLAPDDAADRLSGRAHEALVRARTVRPPGAAVDEAAVDEAAIDGEGGYGAGGYGEGQYGHGRDGEPPVDDPEPIDGEVTDG